MNAKAIQARRDALVADYEKNERAAETAKLMREAIHGAIQDCDHWLKVLAAEEETARLATEGKPPAGLELVKTPQSEADLIAEAEQREATREAAAG